LKHSWSENIQGD